MNHPPEAIRFSIFIIFAKSSTFLTQYWTIFASIIFLTIINYNANADSTCSSFPTTYPLMLEFLLSVAEFSISIRLFSSLHNYGRQICSFIAASRCPIFGKLS